MLYSMTGFGRVEQSIGDKTFLVEVKSLNGKQFDMRLTLPTLLRPYEFDIRNMVSEELVRGSVECIITLKQSGSAKPVTINTDLIKAYYEPVSKIAKDLNIASENILSTLLKLPEVIVPTADALSETEWQQMQQLLMQALKQLSNHREEEGKSLENDLLARISCIEEQQKVLETVAPQRKAKIKENIVKLLEENVGKENYDGNRMEQELIYYIEKIDISEEQVRLKNHCDYFRTILNEQEKSKGKKLSFILQEMGREINTTGSKANDATLQKTVVLMKDELEKAKEQVLNVL